MKPERILWLEKQFGVELIEIEQELASVYRIINEGRTYILNKNKQIVALSIQKVALSDVSFLSKLTSLTSLNLDNNQLSDVSILSELTNLTSLSLGNNQLSDVSFLSELTDLTSLNLGNNQVSDFSFLSKLTNLTSLNLTFSRLSDISFLSKSLGLIELGLSGNPISDYSFVMRLKGLKSLELVFNQLSDLSFLSELKELTYLNVSVNYIKEVTFLTKITGLTSLNLNDNKISDLSFIKKLTNLVCLYLSYNKISDTKNVKKLLSTNIKQLCLYGNPITYLPKELLGSWEYDNCLQDLRNYYQNQDFVPNKEIKVVILGNGMVGKSTLLKRFLNPTGDWEKEIKIDVSKRTEGVAIERKEDFKLEGNEEVNLNIWDFGGQEVYHGTHRLFLDKDAVYIIVWTLETDEKEYEIRQDLDYWLDYAQDLAIDSPIIIVHSQCEKDSDEKRQKINKQIDISEEPKYKENIVENYLPFSAKQKIGVEELDEAIKKAITETNLSTRIKTKIPKKWSDLRDELRKLSKGVKNKKAKVNEISKQNYQDFCDKYKIGESEAETVLTFLHRTGFLYYDEKLSKNIILNQTWAIEAIYEALKPKSIAKTSKGKLEYEDLENFWLEKNYSETEAKTFIDFMVSSEICFCKEQQNYRDLENPTFIVPHYLEEPNSLLIEWDKPNSFYMIYKPQFFHKGIAERFLSRLGRLSGQNALWKDGILLKSDVFSSKKALIIFDREKKEVNISTENYELLEAVLKELNKILDEGSQTKPSEKVTFFYSLDGEEFVSKEKIDYSKKSKGELVENTKGVMVELNPFLEKYHFSTQKSVSKESNFENEEKQNETLLIKEANNKKNTTVMNENQTNSTIQKALKHIENANYGGYFEEMDKIVPTFQRAIYSELKGKFIAGNIPYNFYQSLSTFARELNNQSSSISNPSTSTNSNDMPSNQNSNSPITINITNSPQNTNTNTNNNTQNQSQQIDFKAFENSLLDLQRNLGYAKQEIEEKINKEGKNAQLTEAKEVIEKTIEAAEQIEEEAEKAVEGDKKAEKNIKKDKFGFFRAVKTCASYIPKIAEKASNPKTWEDAQKSLEAAGKFGEQLGGMM